MSNSAFIVIKPFPKFAELDNALRTIVGIRFPMFQLTAGDKQQGWVLQYPNHPDFAMSFWISKFERHKAIEIPHRHSYAFLRWVEYEIRERIANHYDAVQYDDSFGNICKNAKNYFETYSDYLKYYYNPIMVANYCRIAKDELKGLPKDIVKLHGPLFKRKRKAK